MDSEKEELISYGITHMFSTGTIYQIHRSERFKLWGQLAKIMKPGGKLVFDDAIWPNAALAETDPTNGEKVIPKAAKESVYDRLHLEALEDAASYEATLGKAGFKVDYSEDMSAHQGKSYEHLSVAAKKFGHVKLGSDYDVSVEACARGDFGWHLFVATLQGKCEHL